MPDDGKDNAFGPYVEMLRGILGKRLSDTSSLLTMLAADVVVEHPFADPPVEFNGLPDFRKHYNEMSQLFEIDRAEALSCYLCADNSVIVSEFVIEGYWRSNVARFTNRGVLIMEIKDSHIASYKEYWNPLQAIPPIGANQFLQNA